MTSMKQEPEKSSHEVSVDEPGKYLPTSTTVVTPLINARLLALIRASLLTSTETSGMHDVISFIVESTNKPVASAVNFSVMSKSKK